MGNPYLSNLDLSGPKLKTEAGNSRRTTSVDLIFEEYPFLRRTIGVRIWCK